MLQKSNMALKQNSPYSAGITREQFLFYEMRTTAKLLTEGLSQEQVVARIVSDNLFQYPTEKSIRGMARACIHRLEAMEDETLIRAVAEEPSEVAKQICLYAMMREHRLVWDFMLTVIGEKYRLLDSSYSRSEINVFMLRLQEQDDWVATWSAETINRVGQVLQKILMENEYIDGPKATRLNPVLICPILENAIRSDGQAIVLPAFNCLS